MHVLIIEILVSLIIYFLSSWQINVLYKQIQLRTEYAPFNLFSHKRLQICDYIFYELRRLKSQDTYIHIVIL